VTFLYKMLNIIGLLPRTKYLQDGVILAGDREI